jgi:hypothetical protein
MAQPSVVVAGHVRLGTLAVMAPGIWWLAAVLLLGRRVATSTTPASRL